MTANQREIDKRLAEVMRDQPSEQREKALREAAQRVVDYADSGGTDHIPWTAIESLAEALRAEPNAEEVL